MAMGRPILALSPGTGEVRHILERTGTGWCVDFGDAGAIRAMLQQACRRVDEGTEVFEPRWEEIHTFERARLADLYGRNIRAITGQ
jgi:hypothetical protein